MMIKYTVGTNILLNIINIYADVDAISMTPSRNTRSYTLRSVPSSPGRSFFKNKVHVKIHLAVTPESATD